MSNLAHVGGTVLGALGGPIATAANAAANAIAGVDPLNPFEKPTGTTDTYSYDKGSAVDNKAMTDADKLAPARPKKKKPAIRGFTLLPDAPGVLVGT